ncbi:flagellinolysin [Paenibacillus hamazuiensis]|uniref:flagellinolysin n=1 Tax=Paenibacillus hamazuiensis TaxID=2936508 RepID=UPI00200DA799|nr:flagellinolysin [Paenibacillus hamazuiensis]
MRINHNITALTAWQSNLKNQNNTEQSLHKLSSGLRINSAADDAAGLSISEKMRGQLRGLGQASRNIQDGISLLQTAEGGLKETHALLQRGRELAVQAANDTNSEDDRKQLQSEMKQIIKEVDRIANTTEFNTINLLNKDSVSGATMAIVKKLKEQWLKNSVDRIQTQFGLTGTNVALDINVIQGAAGGKLAYVTSYGNGSPGPGSNLSLTVEMADYNSTDDTIGGLAADRTIAHEMVHAVMASRMNWSQSVNATETTGISTWFKEGTAEFIHGADERVVGDLAALGGDTAANRQALVDNLGSAGAAWVNDSAHYSAAYLAVRYMDSELSGVGGIKNVMTYLAADSTRTLAQAIQNATGGRWTDLADFKNDFKANGANFASYGVNLSNSDTGAIGGLDNGGSTALTDTTVIADTIGTADPTPFDEKFPSDKGAEPLLFHVGANTDENLSVTLSKMDSKALGIDQIDLVTDANNAISTLDDAINSVSANRSKFGALQNRLEHALSITLNYHENLTASESRIRDVDLAREMTSFTKTRVRQ